MKSILIWILYPITSTIVLIVTSQHFKAYQYLQNLLISAILFHKIGVINFGRAIAFLSFVYLLEESEEVMRNAVQLVAPLLKTLDLRKSQNRFFP